MNEAHSTNVPSFGLTELQVLHDISKGELMMLLDRPDNCRFGETTASDEETTQKIHVTRLASPQKKMRNEYIIRQGNDEWEKTGQQ
jgi:hypothetical protein